MPFWPCLGRNFQTVSVLKRRLIRCRLGFGSYDQPSAGEFFGTHSMTIVEDGGYRFVTVKNVQFHVSGVSIERILPQL